MHAISAVGVHNPIAIGNKIIALENESLALAANQAGIPVIDLSQPLEDIISQCAEYAIDVILMSCYARRLPEQISGLAAKGCYNMHPSLLPGFRGPEPVFWQMKQASDIGVSWHRVIHEIDAGDVVAQQSIIADDGVSYPELCLQLAECGAELMLTLLSAITENRLTNTPQDPAKASYYRYPVNNDFEIDDSCSARQLYNFMRATHSFAVPYRYQSANQQFYLDAALDYDNNLMLDSTEIQGNRLFIPCNEGVLIATYTDKMPVKDHAV